MRFARDNPQHITIVQMSIGYVKGILQFFFEGNLHPPGYSTMARRHYHA